MGSAIVCGIAGLVALFLANKMRLKQAAARAKGAGALTFAAKQPIQMPYWIAV